MHCPVYGDENLRAWLRHQNDNVKWLSWLLPVIVNVYERERRSVGELSLLQSKRTRVAQNYSELSAVGDKNQVGAVPRGGIV